MPFILFGLTGGIACGKSTVAGFFRARGLPVIDADVVAREVVAPGSPGLASVVDAFGRGVLGASGGLQRKALAAIIFRDPEARKTLERIVHPLIRDRTRQLASELEAQGHPLAAYEAALLVENGLTEAFRPLVVVAVEPDVQVRRLMERDGIDEAQARARLRSQLPIEAKVAVADHVINTEGSLEMVRDRSAVVLGAVCAGAGVDAGRYGL